MIYGYLWVFMGMNEHLDAIYEHAFIKIKI